MKPKRISKWFALAVVVMAVLLARTGLRIYRNALPVPPGTFRLNGDLWQQERASERSWADAKVYCASLSLAGGGWQLPTKNQLGTLTESKRITPVVSDADNYYWSSTPADPARHEGEAWGFNIAYNDSYTLPVAFPLHVRCVR